MKPKSVLLSVTVISFFLFSFYGKNFFSEFFPFTFTSNYVKIAYAYLWWLLPTTVACGFLFGFNKYFTNIGIQNGFLSGFLFALICVFPMFFSSFFIGTFSNSLSILDLTHKTLLAGLMEEYLFRGFLFGLLFRKASWGFVPSALLGSIIFGLGHIYQGSTPTETFGIFMITSMGAAWFAWLYVEWNYNLWIPIFMHILMNLSWSLFEISDNALGGFYSNLFRAITIAMSIIITIRYHKKRGIIVKKSNLLVHKVS